MRLEADSESARVWGWHHGDVVATGEKNEPRKYPGWNGEVKQSGRPTRRRLLKSDWTVGQGQGFQRWMLRGKGCLEYSE